MKNKLKKINKKKLNKIFTIKKLSYNSIFYC